MTGFDMSSMFEDLSVVTQNTLTDSIKMIDIADLHESKDNFFTMERIEELADTILGQGGIKDNLIVRPLELGGYEIISGHRRKSAVQLLLDRGENISRLLPCLVQNYQDEQSKMLDLILMNVSARKLSDSELMKSYEVLNQLIQDEKDKGKKYGRLRETLANMLGVSPAQIGKIQNIEKNAIPEIKEAVTKGEISLSTANEIAKLSDDKQEELASKPLVEIKPKAIQKKVDTNINFSENEADESELGTEKVDTNINFSENEAEESEFEIQKVDTNINFSETKAEESELENQKVDININFSENEADESNLDTQKVDTNINFSDDEDILKFIEQLYDMTENGTLPKLTPTWWSAVNKLYHTSY